MSAATNRPVAVAAAAIAAGLVVRGVWAPTVRSDALRVVVETPTLAGAIALVVALLIAPRRRALSRSLLVCAFGVMAWLSYGWGVVPVLDGLGRHGALSGWAAVLTRALLAAVFAAAAWHPDRVSSSLHRGHIVYGSAVLAGLAGSASVGHFVMLTQPAQETSFDAMLEQGWLTLAVRALSLALWGVAAVGFWRRAGGGSLEVRAAAWVATLYTVGIAYAVTAPTRPVGLVTPVDAYRAAAGVLMFVFALRILAAQKAAARAKERTELAELIHRGIAQELALIAMLRSAPLSNGDELVDAAARRALDEARGTIRALRAEPPEQPVSRGVA